MKLKGVLYAGGGHAAAEMSGHSAGQREATPTPRSAGACMMQSPALESSPLGEFTVSTRSRGIHCSRQCSIPEHHPRCCLPRRRYLVIAGARARGVKSDDSAAGSSRKAVARTIRVVVVSIDRTHHADVLYVGAHSARDVNRGEIAAGVAQEAVQYRVPVIEDSRNLPSGVDAVTEGALVCTGARAGRVERSDRAIGSTNVAMIHGVGVKDDPAELPVSVPPALAV